MFGLTYLKLGAIAGVALLAFVAGWKVEGWRWSAAQTDAIQAALTHYQQETKQAAAASQALETAKEKSDVHYRTITRTVTKIVEKPVYRRECLDADGLRAANAALAGPAAAGGEPNVAVPGPDAAK